MLRNVRPYAAALIVLALTIAVFWPVREYGFINLDDPDNVSRNPLVYNGLTPGGIMLALKTNDPDYWRPLTWLSFMLDTEVYGAHAQPTSNPLIPLEIPHTQARGFHLTNVYLHALTAAILLLALHRLTGYFWRSVIIAAIFAVHPLRVESVAWITERKDVLSGVLAFAALWAYAHYGHGTQASTRSSANWLWLAIATLLLSLGLMAKSTLVTLPFVFLLLDYWPLRRFDFFDSTKRSARVAARLLLEKVPMFIIITVSSWITMHGGQRSVADLSLKLRVANAIVSYIRYIGKMFWPVDLAVYYPYPGIGGLESWSRVHVLAALALLAAITVAAVALMRKRSSFIVGWLWFVGMLVPVIGLLQVGNQALADRFTYLPGIGLMVAVVWLAADAIGSTKAGRTFLGVVSLAVLVACILSTRTLLPTWRDTDAVFQRALNVTHKNRPVHVFYGDYLYHQGQFEAAREQFNFAAELTPEDSVPPFKLGLIYAQLKQNYEAQKAFERTIQIDPAHSDAHFNLGMILTRRGQPSLAAPYFEKADQLNPAKAAEYRRLRAEQSSFGGSPAGARP